MKTTPAALLVVFCLALIASGCALPVAPYTGVGQVRDTTYWADGVIRRPEYTIQLPDFALNTSVEQEYNLGNINFFHNTSMGVYMCFYDRSRWVRFSQYGSSPLAKQQIHDLRLQDIDKIQARLHLRVMTKSGRELFSYDKLLKDCIWSGWQLPGQPNRIDIYDFHNNWSSVPKQEDLQLSISYIGEPLLTNAGFIILRCHK